MYKLSNTNSIIRLADGAYIPADSGNSDYVKYLDWAKSNTAQPADIIPKTFAPLSPAQVRLVLNQFGLLTTVETAIASGDIKLKIEWEHRTEFERNNALLNSMAKALGMSDAQIDQLFTVGITL